MTPSKPGAKILLVASVPSTLWAFYRRMPECARARGVELAVAASPGRALRFFADQCGVRTHPVLLARRISPIADFGSVVRLARLIRRHRYDLVHAFTSKAGLVAMAAARLARCPHRVYSMLGLPAETASGLTRTLLIGSERFASRRAEVVLACSDSLRRRIEDLRICNGPKLRVLADGTCCGVDARRFARTADVLEAARAKRRTLGIPDDALVIGFVGRLVFDKGIHTTVDAFVRLARKRLNLYLVLLGDFEPNRGRVPERTVEEIRRHERIRHIGFEWDPMWGYAMMDVLVLASHREGFPYALLEAACMEVPAVATQVTGCVDAVVDGETGLLVPMDDAAALADAIERLLADGGLRERMGRAARARIESRFTDDRLLDAHFTLYESLLGGGCDGA